MPVRFPFCFMVPVSLWRLSKHPFAQAQCLCAPMLTRCDAAVPLGLVTCPWRTLNRPSVQAKCSCVVMRASSVVLPFVSLVSRSLLACGVLLSSFLSKPSVYVPCILCGFAVSYSLYSILLLLLRPPVWLRVTPLLLVDSTVFFIRVKALRTVPL